MTTNLISLANKKKGRLHKMFHITTVNPILPFWCQQKVSLMALKELLVVTQKQNKHHAISSHLAESEQVQDDFVVQAPFLYNDL